MNESRRFYVYVANRVELIRSITSPNSWKYVRSEENPADIATRGCTASKLITTHWLSGPDFLSNGEDLQFESYEPDNDDRELRSVKSCATNVTKNPETTCSLCDYFEYFGTWSRLVRSIARLKITLRNKTQKTYQEDVDRNLLLDAEVAILKHVQQESFAAEIKVLQEPDGPNSRRQLRGLRLHNLDPFLHEDIIRVGGRLRQSELPFPEKHPVVLPKNNHVTRLLSQHIHEKNHHQGRSITHGAIRQAGYWIIGGTDVVNTLIRNCIRCRLLRKPTETPKMADLPEDRLCQTPPFTNVGIDAFGPWEITTRRTRGGSINNKRWHNLFMSV